MVCPNCSHVYPISNGIPNMVRLLSRAESLVWDGGSDWVTLGVATCGT